MEEVTKVHDFKATVFGTTVFAKDFDIDEFNGEYNLKLVIYNSQKVKIEEVLLNRITPTKWRWEKHKELKPVGLYKYSLFYLVNNTERQILKGLIPVNSVV